MQNTEHIDGLEMGDLVVALSALALRPSFLGCMGRCALRTPPGSGWGTRCNLEGTETVSTRLSGQSRGRTCLPRSPPSNPPSHHFPSSLAGSTFGLQASSLQLAGNA